MPTFVKLMLYGFNLSSLKTLALILWHALTF